MEATVNEITSPRQPMTVSCTLLPFLLPTPLLSHLKPHILCNLVALIDDGHHSRECLTKKEVPAHTAHHTRHWASTAPYNKQTLGSHAAAHLPLATATRHTDGAANTPKLL